MFESSFLEDLCHESKKPIDLKVGFIVLIC